jgi:hypothetical protein
MAVLQITDAQEAKRHLLRCLAELEAAGFTAGGHWSGNVLIQADADGRRDYTSANYAEIEWCESGWTSAADELARMEQ